MLWTLYERKTGKCYISLYRTHNYIQSINSTAIADLRQLDLLDLAYNDIMDIYVGTFPANLTLTKL